MGVWIAKSLKSIEEVQMAEAEAKDIVEKAEKLKERRLEAARARAHVLVNGAEMESKASLEQEQKRVMDIASQKRTLEGKEIAKMAEKIKRQRLSKAKAKRVVKGSLDSILGA